MVNESALPDAYRRQFPDSEPAVLVRAPGRVNLVGEHVDYNDGLVLPIAIGRSVRAVAGISGDDRINVHSATLGQSVDFHPHDIQPPNPPTWDAYAKGVVAGLVDSDVSLVGTNIYLESDLPVGGGLASSAAVEIAVALSLLAVSGANMGAGDLARLCQRAENDYARVPCGIMDQLTCAMGLTDHALLIDCRDNNVKYIPWRSAGVVVLIAPSGEDHNLPDGPYATRVDECRQALDALRRVNADARSLRDVSAADLRIAQVAMEVVLVRRARHVITEIHRAEAAAKALDAGDYEQLGSLMNDSHESLRRDYQVSSPRLDSLAEFLRQRDDVFGARMTGAGFGGCVVALARRAQVPDIETALAGWYNDHDLPAMPAIVTSAAAGASATAISTE